MIELQDVDYSYDGGTLLSGLTFALPAGSFHFLTGPSGSGKSTLLKLLYAELRATRGSVQIFDQDAGQMSRDEVAKLRRRIGVVHQDCQFLDHLSLAENVALPLAVQGRPIGQDLQDLMAWVGLSERANARPPELSGGERQRAALARAVLLAPDIILADEPTGNIDWEMSQRVLTLLIELHKLGKTILVATHDMALVRAAKQKVAARVLRIKDAQVQLAGAEL
ncbi:MAG: ATP-binding cassette domain-containing protein [Pseudomonadota bacterium]